MSKLPLVSLDRPRAYVRLTPDPVFRTKVYNKNINLDLSAQGTLVGVEFLKTSKSCKQLLAEAVHIRKAHKPVNLAQLALGESILPIFSRRS